MVNIIIRMRREGRGKRRTPRTRTRRAITTLRPRPSDQISASYIHHRLAWVKPVGSMSTGMVHVLVFVVESVKA